MTESPLTLKKNIKKIDSFSVDRICNDYSILGVDVRRFFNSELIHLYECIDSNYRFYYPFSTIGDAQFYKDLSIIRKNYYLDRWEHKIALQYLQKKDRVLEIGSGFGAFLNLLKQNNIKGKGLEINAYAVKKCKDIGLDVQNKLIQEEVNDHESDYDAVCYFQVLEHIAEINDFINASIKVLKPNGNLIICVPNSNPYIFINDKYHTLNLPPHHAGLWNRKSLKSLEKYFPLKLVSMEFEPLESTYSYFINFQINHSSFWIKTSLYFLNKIMPKFLRKVLCKSIRGRNILAVYKKI